MHRLGQETDVSPFTQSRETTWSASLRGPDLIGKPTIRFQRLYCLILFVSALLRESIRAATRERC